MAVLGAMAMVVGAMVARDGYYWWRNRHGLSGNRWSQQLDPERGSLQVVLLTDGNQREIGALVMDVPYRQYKPPVVRTGDTESYFFDSAKESAFQWAQLKSTYRVAYGVIRPDPNVTGVWIDGVKRRLGSPYLIIYMTADRKAIDVPLTEAERDVFAAEARNTSDLFALVEKWVRPRAGKGPASRAGG